LSTMMRRLSVFERGVRRKSLKSCLLLRDAALNKTPLFGCQMRVEKPSVSGEVLPECILLRGLSKKCHRSPCVPSVPMPAIWRYPSFPGVRRDRSKKLQNVTAVTEASSRFWQGFC